MNHEEPSTSESSNLQDIPLVPSRMSITAKIIKNKRPRGRPKKLVREEPIKIPKPKPDYYDDPDYGPMRKKLTGQPRTRCSERLTDIDASSKQAQPVTEKPNSLKVVQMEKRAKPISIQDSQPDQLPETPEIVVDAHSLPLSTDQRNTLGSRKRKRKNENPKRKVQSPLNFEYESALQHPNNAQLSSYQPDPFGYQQSQNGLDWRYSQIIEEILSVSPETRSVSYPNKTARPSNCHPSSNSYLTSQSYQDGSDLQPSFNLSKSHMLPRAKSVPLSTFSGSPDLVLSQNSSPASSSHISQNTTPRKPAHLIEEILSIPLETGLVQYPNNADLPARSSSSHPSPPGTGATSINKGFGSENRFSTSSDSPCDVFSASGSNINPACSSSFHSISPERTVSVNTEFGSENWLSASSSASQPDAVLLQNSSPSSGSNLSQDRTTRQPSHLIEDILSVPSETESVAYLNKAVQSSSSDPNPNLVQNSHLTLQSTPNSQHCQNHFHNSFIPSEVAVTCVPPSTSSTKTSEDLGVTPRDSYTTTTRTSVIQKLPKITAPNTISPSDNNNNMAKLTSSIPTLQPPPPLPPQILPQSRSFPLLSLPLMASSKPIAPKLARVPTVNPANVPTPPKSRSAPIPMISLPLAESSKSSAPTSAPVPTMKPANVSPPSEILLQSRSFSFPLLSLPLAPVPTRNSTNPPPPQPPQDDKWVLLGKFIALWGREMEQRDMMLGRHFIGNILKSINKCQHKAQGSG